MNAKLNVVKQSKLFKWCEMRVPYWPIPFLSKRTRVKWRQYFRYHHLQKVQKQLCDILRKVTINPVNWNEIGTDFACEWEIITRNNE